MTSNGSVTGKEIAAWRTGVAGAMAGALTASALHPIDTAKTLRQAAKGSRGGRSARSLSRVLLDRVKQSGFFSLYAGLIPAVLGSAPSSALYFGTYEFIRKRMYSADDPTGADLGEKGRLLRNMASAASGNVASSVLFVPKEVIKNRMQTGQYGRKLLPAIRQMTTKANGGAASLYAGYTATLLRNIPSNMMKFAFYEECKLFILKRKRRAAPAPVPVRRWWQRKKPAPSPEVKLTPREHVLAGAVSGVLASGITTPMDVVKTRFATAKYAELALSGALGKRVSVGTMIGQIASEQGLGGFFVGLRARVMWSAFFAAIGFSSYEWCKQAMTPRAAVASSGKKNSRFSLARGTRRSTR